MKADRRDTQTGQYAETHSYQSAPGQQTARAHLTPSGSFKRVLRNKSFLLLWLAQLISQIGFNAANYGIILLVTEITGSTFMVGIAIVSFTLPAVPFSILASVYVDYLDKRLILWVCNALRAFATGMIVVALLWNRRALLPLYLLSFFMSVITQFFTPAESSTIPLLVGIRDVMPALSLFSITLTLAQALGFLLLGQLITLLVPPFKLSIGPAVIPVQPVDLLFFIIAVAYFICMWLILAIPPHTLRYEGERKQWIPRGLGEQIKNIARYDVRASWALVRQNHILFMALMRAATVSVLLMAIGELAGPFVKNVLHLPANALSLIFAPAGVALVLGGLTMPHLTGLIGKGRTITIGTCVAAIGLILLPLGQMIGSILYGGMTGIIVVAAMSFVIGFALDMINIPAQTYLQEHTPENERGRVFAFLSMLYSSSSIPILLFVGLIAQAASIQVMMCVLGIVILLFQFWAASIRI